MHLLFFPRDGLRVGTLSMRGSLPFGGDNSHFANQDSSTAKVQIIVHNLNECLNLDALQNASMG